MNLAKVTAMSRKTIDIIKKHSPKILTGLGIAGMIITTITAVKATPKAMAAIEQKEKEENRELSVKEKIKVSWRYYLPSALTGSASIAALISASSISTRRETALAAAYALSENAFKDYQDKALDIVGEKKEQEIRDAVAKERMDKVPVINNEIITTGRGDTLCYDALSGRYFKSDIESIRKAENNFNRKMRDDVRMTLNELYDEIGIPAISIGENLGWDINVGRGYVDFEFSSHLTDSGVPCLVVGHRNPPKYIY